MKKFALLIFTLVIYFSGTSQSVTKVNAIVNGDKVNISYTLGGASNQYFNVSLYVTLDGGKTYQGPLKSVTGDIGINILPGNRKIVWDALKEIDVKDIPISFEIRAQYKPVKAPKNNQPNINNTCPSHFMGYEYLPTAQLGYSGADLGDQSFYWSIRTGFNFGHDYVTWINDSLEYIPLIGNDQYIYTGIRHESIAALAVGWTVDVGNYIFLDAGIGGAYRNSLREVKVNYTQLADVKIIENSGFRGYLEAGVKIRLYKFYVGGKLTHVLGKEIDGQYQGLTNFGFSVGYLIF